jgi:solute carrier family 25 oxoglutarate transporter 11
MNDILYMWQADGLLPPSERRNYKDVMDALVTMVKQEGVLALWTGSALTVQRAMVVTACQLAAYDHIKEGLLRSGMLGGEGPALYVVASFAAGTVAAAASNPIDVVRTRIMTMKAQPGCPCPYSSPLDCALKTVRQEGSFLALYKGFLPTLTRQGPFTVVLFLTLELLRKALNTVSSVSTSIARS